MKKVILSVMLVAFAVAVQAGDAKSCADKEQGGCCPKAKPGAEAKAECPMAKQAKAQCPMAKQAKAGEKDAPVKQALASPKATK